MSAILPYLYVVVLVFLIMLVLYTVAYYMPSAGKILARVFATHFLVNWLAWGELWIKDRQEEVASSFTKGMASIERLIADKNAGSGSASASGSSTPAGSGSASASGSSTPAGGGSASASGSSTPAGSGGGTGKASAHGGHASVVGLIIVRIFWFIVVGGLILGELYNVIAAVPALFNVGYPNLPDLFVIASACLFICPALAFGGVLLEMLGITFPHDRLFPKLGPILSKVLAVFAAIGLGMTLVVVFEFFQFRALYLDPALRNNVDPIYISDLKLTIFDFLALSVLLAIAFLWHAFTIGFEAIIVLFTGLLSLFLLIVNFIISLIPRSIERMTWELSDGAISPYDKARRMATGKGFQKGPSGRNKEDKDMRTELCTSVIFGGTFGSEAFEQFVTRFETFRSDVLFTAGFLDLRADLESKIIPTWITDVSPDPAARQAYGSRPSRNAYEKMFEDMGKQQIEHHYYYRTAGSVFIYVLDHNLIDTAEEMLKNVHLHLPQHALVVVTSVTSQALGVQKVKDNLAVLSRLRTEGVLAVSIIIDPTSPFADKWGAAVQMEFAAHAIMGLASAYKYKYTGDKYKWENHAAAQILIDKLPSDYPFLSLSFASEDVLPSNPPPPPSKQSPFFAFLSQSPKKEQSDAIRQYAQTQAVKITRKITAANADTRACYAPFEQNRQAILLCHAPLPIGASFAEFSIRYCGLFEWAGSSGTGGSGTGSSGIQPLPDFSILTLAQEGWWNIQDKQPKLVMQVTCFYPVKDSDALIRLP